MLHQNLFYNDDHQATCLQRPRGKAPGRGCPRLGENVARGCRAVQLRERRGAWGTCGPFSPVLARILRRLPVTRQCVRTLGLG